MSHPSVSPVAAVEVIPLATGTSRDRLDSGAETVVVRVTDEQGRTGIGETDAPPAAVGAFLTMPTAHGWSQGPVEVVLGADPFELGALSARLYDATQWAGRRGLGIHALSALEIALHDLAGRQLGRPVYQLLGGARRERLQPYATVYPGEHATLRAALDATERIFDAVLAAGYKRVKMECLYGDMATDAELVQAIGWGRGRLGEGVELLVDFGYRWRDWRRAAWVLERVAEHDVRLAEAALQHDDLDGHARLAGRSPVPVGGAEMAATRHECREWLERGRVDVVQADVTRCGGFQEAIRIAQLCEERGAQYVPHGWKTGITAAVGRHLHAAAAACPTFEHLPVEAWDSELRRALVGPEPAVAPDGSMDLPRGPGLGIDLDEDLVARLRTDRGPA